MLWKKYYTRRIQLLETILNIFKRLQQCPEAVTPDEYIKLAETYEELKTYDKSNSICEFITWIDGISVRYSRTGIYYTNTFPLLFKEADNKSKLSKSLLLPPTSSSALQGVPELAEWKTISPPDLRFIFILYQNSELYDNISKRLSALIKHYEDKSKLSFIGQSTQNT